LGLLGFLAACDSSQLRDCETQLKEKLKSPASYKRVKADEMLIDVHKPPYYDVTITYDAANSYNALLRDQETCFYHPGTTNRFDPFGTTAENVVDMNATDMNATVSDADVNAASDEATREADAALQAAEQEVAAANNAVAAAESAVNDMDNDAGE
jgi:hypothetical protein